MLSSYVYKLDTKRYELLSICSLFLIVLFERELSIKRDCSSEAEIPRFSEIFSKLPLETVDVSTINRTEFLSGTEEFADLPEVNIGDDIPDAMIEVTKISSKIFIIP